MSTARDTGKPVILFIAEAVTLAHFARIITLAKALPADRYEIVVASDPRYAGLETTLPFEIHPIHSIPSAQFIGALAQGKAVYDAQTLSRYVEEDLALIDRFKPDLVIGDFRLSLAVSAPLRKTPYANVVNAYWSPLADTDYPVPDLPFTRLLGVPLAQRLFDLARPLVFAWHARPLNRVRTRYGLPPLGRDLRQSYTWGDFTLYADIPDVVPLRHKPARHHYLGPILWSTRTPLPEWWERLPEDKPIVFIGLGSSGRNDLLPLVLKALAALPLTVMAATVGKMDLPDLPENVFVAEYLALDVATQRAHLIISNGGSLSTYQALALGKPVIGIAGNMDQLLNMQAVERLGAGITLRSDSLTTAAVQQAANTVLDTPSYLEAAGRTRQILAGYDTAQRFRDVVSGILGRDASS